MFFSHIIPFFTKKKELKNGLNSCYTPFFKKKRNKLKFDELDKLKELFSERRSNKKRKNKTKKIEAHYYCYLHSLLYQVRKIS